MATPTYNEPRESSTAFSMGQQELLRLKNRIRFIEEAFEKLDDDPTDNIPTKVSQLQNDAGYITNTALTPLETGVSTLYETYSYPNQTVIAGDNYFTVNLLKDHIYHITNNTTSTIAAWVWEYNTSVVDITEGLAVGESANFTVPMNLTHVRVYANGTGTVQIVDTISGYTAIQKPIPTKTSELTNDAGFVTADEIPEQSNVPTKVSDLTNDSGFITAADIPAVPTKVSDLTNDTGFITSSAITPVSTGVGTLYDYLTYPNTTIAVGDNYFNAKLIPGHTYQIVNNTTASIAAWVWNNGASIVYITGGLAPDQGATFSVSMEQSLMRVYASESGTVQVVDVTSGYSAITKPTISKTSELQNDAGFITAADIPAVPTKVSDLTNDTGFITSASLPTVPTKVSDLTNDAGYLTADDYDELSASISKANSGISTLYSFYGTTEKNLSAGDNYFSANLVSGHTYRLINGTSSTIAAWVWNNGSSVVEITGGLASAEGATFTVSSNQSQIRVYANGSGTIQVVDAASNMTALLTPVPTKVSELQNDAGFITSSDIPTIPTKISDLTDDSDFITEDDLPTVPTKVSELTNDTGFITDSALSDITGDVEQLQYDVSAFDGLYTKDSASVTTSNYTFITVRLIKGHTYHLFNDTDSSIAAWVWNSSSDSSVLEITGGLTAGQGANFTVSSNQTLIRVWANGAGSIKVSDTATNCSAIPMIIPTKTSDLINDSGFGSGGSGGSSDYVRNIISWNHSMSSDFGEEYVIRAVWNGDVVELLCINRNSDTTAYPVLCSGIIGGYVTEAQVRAIVSEMMG